MIGRRLTTAVVCVLYFVSGLTGLVYEVTFSKYLSYVFGATAYASSAVLLAFMAGLSVGGFFVARYDARLVNRLLFYGAAEALIGVFCLVSPVLFEVIARAYVALAHGMPASVPIVAAIRCVLATAVVFLPAVAMGATLPLLAPLLRETRGTRMLSTLYALNILGGASGSLLAAYAVIPAVGLSGTLRFAAFGNLAIGVVAVWLSRRIVAISGGRHDPSPSGDPAGVVPTSPLGRFAPLVLGGASGLLVFATEVVFVHLLALVIGTSVYAFGLMLAIFLLCLGLGAWLGPWVASRTQSAAPLAAAAASLALAVSVPVWDHLPGLFDAMRPYASTWGAREAGRAVVAFLVLCLPATAMGTLFPIVLRQIGRGRDLGAEVGRMTAINTLGSIAGSVVGGFALLPWLGSQRSLLVIAASYAALAVATAPASGRRAVWAVAVAAVAVAIAAPRWDLVRLTSGANVYFESGPEPDSIEMLREDVHGGVTTVVRSGDLLTLRTNGKFQGDNGDELEAQRAFAHIPCLLVRRHELAFAIGLGTGTTLGALAAYPFRKIEVAELSPAIAEAAKTFFSDINGSVLSDPRVDLLNEDGRNALLVSSRRYDLVAIEISSIWFAGAANLYAREFYAMVKDRLAPGGVLQQWVQFHHIRRRELASVLATVRHVFPHVALFAHGSQGIVIASAEPLVMSRARAGELEARSEVRRLLEKGTSLVDLVADLLVSDAALDRFIEDSAAEAHVAPSALISTDDNLYLEYATPKNNVEGMPSIEDTIASITHYRPDDVLAKHLVP